MGYLHFFPGIDVSVIEPRAYFSDCGSNPVSFSVEELPKLAVHAGFRNLQTNSFSFPLHVPRHPFELTWRGAPELSVTRGDTKGSRTVSKRS
jgi:hypothetical protein